MLTFLYGPDDYRRLRKKKEIVAAFRKKYAEFGLGFFDCEAEGALDALTGFARGQSIFGDTKLAVLENAFEIDAEKLAKVLKPFAADKNTNILIVERGKPVRALAFLLEKPSVAEQFENYEGAEFVAFIKAQAKETGVKLADSAAQFLGMAYAGNSWALVTELQKLGALASGGAGVGGMGGRVIEKNDLDALGLEVAPDYWALLNGMKSFDARIRLMALERLFAMNDPAPRIFNILAAQAGPKTPRMAEYDLAVKSGKLEYEEVLLALTLEA